MGEKSRISVAFIGPFQSGKSTTAGHLTHLCGGVSTEALDQLRAKTYEQGRVPDCMAFTWCSDRLKMERRRGISLVPTLWPCETERHQFTFINIPGHRKFLKNMIRGTSQADVALLVVPAPPNEFEPTIAPDGIASEHAKLAFGLGIKKIIVAINKMDSPAVEFSEARYLEIKAEVSKRLRRTGFADADVQNTPMVPISGANGDNLTERSDRTPWWKGPTLLEALEELTPPPRAVDKPLRMSVLQVHKILGIGTVVVGRVETGTLTPGMTVTFAPSKIVGRVGSIERHHVRVEEAVAGDYVGVNLRIFGTQRISRGELMGASYEPPFEVVEFTAEVTIIKHPGLLKEGYTPMVDYKTAHISCKWTNFIHKVDQRGQPGEEKPSHLRQGDMALVTMVPQKPMCIETVEEYPSLGRIVIRDNGHMVAVGIVKSVHRKQTPLTKAAQKFTA